jgi:tetratricopeptide (TPR) repeat protein
MSSLGLETLRLPAADLGPENPLSALLSTQDLHQVENTEGIPLDMLENISYGRLPNILPYTLQDGYSREQRVQDLKVAVLENDILKATFLLDYGGRLYSLFHKPSQRELLSVNPVFQPANLALRNAWFSGGVEWNIGTIGHTPFTCAPMFAERLEDDKGMPVLRLYEWERIRQVTYSLDFYLPEHSPLLYVYARIINPHEHEVAMYWWSNMAVPESEDIRVIVPAEKAYRFNYEGLSITQVPQFDGVDRSYSTVSKRAVDFFFHLEKNRPWICALDGKGKGLIQNSSSLLKGRKLFLWGTGQGGRRWQEFLSQKGTAYLEIQAGLARTQLEHLKMPARTTWDWLETYGLLEANPDSVHGDWTKAQNEVEQKLEQLSSVKQFEAELETCRKRRLIHKEFLHYGSGWGYLEKRRREKMGEPLADVEMFPKESLAKEQQPWLELLEAGRYSSFDESHPSFMIQREWKELLEASVKNWAAYLQLGVMYAYEGEKHKAREAFESSLEYKETAWVLRNLAALERLENNLEASIKHYQKAHQLKPELLPLVIEYAETLLLAGKNKELLDTVASLSQATKQHGRIRFLEARAALAESRLDIVQGFFDDKVEIADLREGATLLTDLWYGFQARKLSHVENSAIDDDLIKRVQKDYPIPKHFDFRMLES